MSSNKAPDEGVEQAWEDELARRADEIDSETVKLERWSKVREELDDIVRGSRAFPTSHGTLVVS
jgi:hypothetical protein